MIRLHHAEPEDIDHIDSMLRSLSQELGDRHLASIDNLRKAGFGEYPGFHAQIAISTETDAPKGIALYSPLFSTTIGGAGLYLSDLWVAPDQRATGLGSRLIAAACSDAAERWQAGFVKLCVYNDNLPANAFYARLGFTASASAERYLILKGNALADLISTIQTTDRS